MISSGSEATARANLSISIGEKSFPVTDPILRLIVLSQIAATPDADRRVGSGSDDGGHGNDALARIRSLPFEDLVRMSQVSRGASFTIVVDIKQLTNDVNCYDRMQAANAMYEYFIRAEASISMMIELFKTSASAVKASQATFGVASRIGRPAFPNDDTRLDIIAEWDRLGITHSFPRERYYALHKLFSQFTMAELDGVINSEAPRANSRRRRGMTKRVDANGVCG